MDRGRPAGRHGGSGALRSSTPSFAARSGGHFPLGILAVNIAGALVLGLVAGAALDGEALIIVAGGVIGSFTTFSTWMFDSHRLADAGLPVSSGSTSASRSSPASPPSPSATGWASRSEGAQRFEGFLSGPHRS